MHHGVASVPLDCDKLINYIQTVCLFVFILHSFCVSLQRDLPQWMWSHSTHLHLMATLSTIGYHLCHLCCARIDFGLIFAVTLFVWFGLYSKYIRLFALSSSPNSLKCIVFQTTRKKKLNRHCRLPQM